MFSNWIQNAFCVPQRKILQQTWCHYLLFENKLIKGLWLTMCPVRQHCQKGYLDLSGLRENRLWDGHPQPSPNAPSSTRRSLVNFFQHFIQLLLFFFFFFLLLSTSVHSPLVSLMFLPLPFFGPSPPWLSAKPLTEGLWSFFNPPGTWHANTTIILIILPLTAFSSGHCHSWQSFSLSHVFFGQ